MRLLGTCILTAAVLCLGGIGISALSVATLIVLWLTGRGSSVTNAFFGSLVGIGFIVCVGSGLLCFILWWISFALNLPD